MQLNLVLKRRKRELRKNPGNFFYLRTVLFKYGTLRALIDLCTKVAESKQNQLESDSDFDSQPFFQFNSNSDPGLYFLSTLTVEASHASNCNQAQPSIAFFS